MLWNREDLGMSQRYEASASAAQEIGITVQPLGVREPDDFNGAFAAMDRERPDAILMVSDSLMLLNRKRVIDYAAERHLPAIYEQDFVTRDGGLMSYGAESHEFFDRAAALVSRISGCEASRPTGRGAGTLSFCNQHENRQSDELLRQPVLLAGAGGD